LASYYRSLRRRILTPGMSATEMSVRGFNVKSPEAKDLLETVGRMFLTGYAFAAEAKSPLDAEVGLEQLPRQFRGFAYEGAGMGFAVRDGLPLGSSRHIEQFLQGRARDHVYMVWVGVGWALARLPRFRWSGVVVEDPLMRGLVLDGYGFHQAYFHTDKYVWGQYQEPNFPWKGYGPAWYSDRAIDQGIGRAMWFVCGTDPKLLCDSIDKFPESRREDLYSGAALAVTYAGGVTEEEVQLFWQRSGKYQPQVAQAAAFAATARYEAGLVIAHTELATQLLCGTTPEQASEICRQARPVPAVDGDVPAHEVWRRQIAEALTSHVRD
jgi:enediyne biosynthesis protein E3